MNFAPASGTRGRLGLLAAALIALPLSVLPASADDVVARVNGKDITAAEVQMATDVFGEQLAQVPEAQRRPMVVGALIDMHVMADAAKAAGVTDSPKYKARMAFLEAQALRNTYVEDELQGKISDDEIKARYEKDIAGFVPPEEVHARHILVKTEDEANAVLKQLADGGNFEAIAKEKSQDPGSKDNGGDLGFFAKGQMVPEFEAEAFALKPGETSTKPVKSQFGYHIIKVEERRTQPVPALDQVREQVIQMVQRDKYQDTLAKMHSAAKIEILDPTAAPAAPAAPADPAAAPATPAPAK
jgi:peptidyl-prolyl cis-trans isomerase C